MRKLLLILAATTCVGVAHADVALIDYLGFSWETGGFPPSDMGDVMNVVGVVDAIDPIFGITLGSGTEVTFHISGLVSNGGILSSGVLTVSYSNGDFDLYEDTTPDHDYGTNPPNGTAPSTFVDGSLLLGGHFSSFFLYLDTSTGAGVYEGYLTFDAGSGLGTINQLQVPGYTFGGAFNTTAVGGNNIPTGYDLQIDGTLQVGPWIAVQQKSWTGIKNLYRH